MSTRINNPDDLKRLRDSAREGLSLRDGTKDIEITVHMGTCGIASGARDVFALVLTEVRKAHCDNVTLRQSGCAGLCNQEPMLTLTEASGKQYRYGKLDASKIQHIMQSHVLGGAPVTELLIQA